MSLRNSMGSRRPSLFRTSLSLDPRIALSLRGDRTRSLNLGRESMSVPSKQKAGVLLYYTGGFRGGWKKKFVSLNNQFIEIYDDEKDEKCRTNIRLAHAMLAHPTINPEKRNRKGLSFEIYEIGGLHAFCAENEDEGNSWVSIIRECIEDARLLLFLAENISSSNIQRQGYLLVTKVDALQAGNIYQVVPTLLWADLGQELSFFPHPPNASEQENTKALEVVDLTRATFESHEKIDGHSFLLLLNTPKEKYLLRASSGTTFVKWVSSIQRAIYQVKRLLEGTGYREGWLIKVERGAWKSPKAAFYILQDGYMNRYTDERATVAEKSLTLFNATVTIKTIADSKPGFSIIMAGKSIPFEAKTHEEAQKWVEAIEAGIRRAKDTKGHIVKQGYLFKDPQALMSKPKYRWFVLRSGILSYYAKDTDKKPIGSFDTSQISVSLPTGPNREKFGFLLKTNKGIYMLSASSREEMQTWVKSLQEVTRRNRSTNRKEADSRDRSLSCPPRLDLTVVPPRSSESSTPTTSASTEPSRLSDTFSGMDIMGMGSAESVASMSMSSRTKHFEYDEDYVERKQSLPFRLDHLNINPCQDSAVVIDTGTSFIRAGYTGDDFPTAVFPSCIEYIDQFTADGLRPGCGLLSGPEAENSYYQLLGRFGPYHPKKSPNLDEMERLWEHAYANELHVVSEDHGAILVEPIGISNKSKERIYEVFFETFRVPYATMKPPSLLSLIAQGKDTGIGVVWGNRLEVSAIANGYVLPFGSNTRNTGGSDVTELMMVLLNRTIGTRPKYTLADARWIKEKYCYVADNFQGEIVASGESRTMERNVHFPVAGRDTSICSERFICPEAMFDPGLLQAEDLGIHQIIYEVISKCDIDLRRDLLKSIVVGGGNTLFRGFTTRLEAEIENMAMKVHKTKITCNIDAPNNRKYLPFIGASRYKTLPGFEDNCFFLNDYLEYGPSLFQL
eukprot:TRINITY_DN1836_c0_g2_i1.p1 TRINITY_DN1836_c0_g2~~TRINITY_DN1836_c0_g2_i1.p1  ORF type:complete len:958 (-),score=180.94 TRINITY_DN1836_c0_g2_i1:472-3345(-)